MSEDYQPLAIALPSGSKGKRGKNERFYNWPSEHDGDDMVYRGITHFSLLRIDRSMLEISSMKSPGQGSKKDDEKYLLQGLLLPCPGFEHKGELRVSIVVTRYHLDFGDDDKTCKGSNDNRRSIWLEDEFSRYYQVYEPAAECFLPFYKRDLRKFHRLLEFHDFLLFHNKVSDGPSDFASLEADRFYHINEGLTVDALCAASRKVVAVRNLDRMWILKRENAELFLDNTKCRVAFCDAFLLSLFPDGRGSLINPSITKGPIKRQAQEEKKLVKVKAKAREKAKDRAPTEVKKPRREPRREEVVGSWSTTDDENDDGRDDERSDDDESSDNDAMMNMPAPDAVKKKKAPKGSEGGAAAKSVRPMISTTATATSSSAAPAAGTSGLGSCSAAKQITKKANVQRYEIVSDAPTRAHAPAPTPAAQRPLQAWRFGTGQQRPNYLIAIKPKVNPPADVQPVAVDLVEQTQKKIAKEEALRLAQEMASKLAEETNAARMARDEETKRKLNNANKMWATSASTTAAAPNAVSHIISDAKAAAAAAAARAAAVEAERVRVEEERAAAARAAAVALAVAVEVSSGMDPDAELDAFFEDAKCEARADTT